MRRVKVFLTRPVRKKAIVNQIRKEKGIVFGQRSINAHTGILSRPTQDWDVFTNKPKKSAMKLEKQLDSQVGFDYFYTKKGVNPGTWKVKGKGDDLKKGTRDDEGIADFTRTPKPSPKFNIIKGVRFRKLNEEIQAKQKTQRDPKFKFRKEKDLMDLKRLQSLKKLQNIKKSKGIVNIKLNKRRK